MLHLLNQKIYQGQEQISTSDQLLDSNTGVDTMDVSLPIILFQLNNSNNVHIREGLEKM
jgi:hypothetical protein